MIARQRMPTSSMTRAASPYRPSTRLGCFSAMLAVMVAGAAIISVEGIHVRPRRCHGAPKHIHLAPGQDASREVIISFATMWAQPGVTAPVGSILIGTSPGRLDREVQEQEYPLTYDTALPDKHWGYYYAPYQHHFMIGGLEPDTTYYYKIHTSLRSSDNPGALRGSQAAEYDEDKFIVDHPDENLGEKRNEEEGSGRRVLGAVYDGSDKDCPVSKVRSFKTAPVSALDTPVSFAMIGDLGQFDHSQHTLASLIEKRHEFDAVVLVGDVAYTELDHRRWDTFFDMIDDYTLFDEMTLAIAAGNHDIEKQETHLEIFQSYEARFRMPRVHPPELGIYSGPKPNEKLNLDAPEYPLPYEWGNSYYSFTYGPAIHIVLNAYSAMEPDSKQYKWFDETLKSVDRNKTPWVLVTIHVPVYSTYNLHNHDPQIFAARDYIEPLCVQRGVNMVFTGHIHAYQRTHNVAGGELHHRAPVHVTVGAGGRKCDAPYRQLEPEVWVAARDASFYGYGIFNIFNHTHAEWKWVPLDQAEKHDGLNYVSHGEIDLPSLRHDSAIIMNTHYLK